MGSLEDSPSAGDVSVENVNKWGLGGDRGKMNAGFDASKGRTHRFQIGHVGHENLFSLLGDDGSDVHQSKERYVGT
jgi:hypothetical protein